MWRNLFRKKIKVIEYNVDDFKVADDPSYPYKLEISRTHPEFNRLPMIMAHGPEEYLVIRAVSLAAAERFVEENNLRTDQLLNVCTIVGPAGEIERFGNDIPNDTE